MRSLDIDTGMGSRFEREHIEEMALLMVSRMKLNMWIGLGALTALWRPYLIAMPLTRALVLKFGDA